MHIPAEDKFQKFAKRSISAGLEYEKNSKKYIIHGDTIYNTQFGTVFYIYKHVYSVILSFNELMSILEVNDNNVYNRFTDYIKTVGCPVEYTINCEYHNKKDAFIYSIGVSFYVIDDDENNIFGVNHSEPIIMTASIPLTKRVYIGKNISVSSTTTDKYEKVDCYIKKHGDCITVSSEPVSACTYTGNDPDDLLF